MKATESFGDEHQLQKKAVISEGKSQQEWEKNRPTPAPSQLFTLCSKKKKNQSQGSGARGFLPQAENKYFPVVDWK